MLCTVALLFVCTINFAQNTFPSSGSTGIGTSSPASSAILEIKSTSKGILTPRMTQSERDAIVSPATGLLIFQTNNSPGFYFYDGAKWVAVASKGVNKSLNNLTSPTAINQSLLPGYDDSINLGNSIFQWKHAFVSGDAFISGLTVGIGGGAISSNTVLGSKAMFINASGANNTAIGAYSLYSNTSGSFNAANGSGALYKNDVGIYNTASGYYALFSNTSGSFNSAFGSYTLFNNTAGTKNSAFGFYSLYNNTTGTYNTALGANALYKNSIGYSNIAVGASALYNNTNCNNIIGIGDSALFFNGVGKSNDFEGSFNTAVGSKALYSNTTGSVNSAFGYTALRANSSGNFNTAMGFRALLSNTTGGYNSSLGSNSLTSNTSGTHNVAIGHDAMYYNTTGSGNTSIGSNSFQDNITGNNNTALGSNTYTAGGNFSNTTIIGYNSIATASNQVRIGDNYITSIGGYQDWTNISDGRVKKNIKENVPGLAFINKLKPVTYNLDLASIDKITNRTNLKDKDGNTIMPSQQELQSRKEKEQIIQTGFIAQDVEHSAKELGYEFSGVDPAKNDKDLYGLRYSEFVVPLVKAVQELSQQNDELKKQIDELKTIITAKQTNNPVTNQQVNISAKGTSDVASLQQNFPNPFNGTTTIKYYLPANINNANINFYAVNGALLKSLKLTTKGNGSINLNAKELPSASYRYALIIDGKTIDSKQMIVTK